MDVMEYQARIAMMSGHHQSDTFWSNEMSMGTVMSLSEIPPGYPISILYFILSMECLLSALWIDFPTTHNAQHQFTLSAIP